MSSIINIWEGRFGNNILQIIRCLYYSIINNVSNILLLNHDFLINNKITIEENINKNKINNKNIYDSFFDLKKFNLDDPSPIIMKNLAIKYILPILKKNIYNSEKKTENNLFMHIRGGDIFNYHPHSAYVQPPVYYYEKIINENNYEKINLIYEDKNNPCVDYLSSNKDINLYSGNLYDDINLLLSATNLVIGFGTFGFVMYLLNPKLKKLYVPDYLLKELPTGDWGDIELIIINLPNYIKVGEWKNTKQQRDLMINYKV